MKQLQTLLVAASLFAGLATALAQPANDNFANRIIQSGSTWTVNGTTASATKEAGEPNHDGNAGGRSVWYEWVAAEAGSVAVVVNAGYRELLGVYTGDAVNSLTLIADATAPQGSGTAEVSFTATAGVSYKIVVDARRGFGTPNGGPFTLSLSMPTVVFPFGSVWKYLDDGTDQGVAWQTNSFDDTAWAQGPGLFGFTVPVPIATTVSFGPDSQNKYITTYFRRSFTIANAAGVASCTARFRRDDGIVVYVNGVEAFRNNMPGGEVNYLTLAGQGSDNAEGINSSSIPVSLLRNGPNLIAVEVHQVNGTSSDLGFDMELSIVGGGNSLPTVAISSPANGASFRPGTNITITATASDSDGTVTNVAFYADVLKLADDATAPYSFTWNNVPQGNYMLTAVATDNLGESRVSAGVNISVNTFTITPVTLIATGSVWKYLDNGSDQGTAWRDLSFNDTAWASGPGELGYGDAADSPSRPEATVLSYGPDQNNKYITTYFRRLFNVSDPSTVSNLTIRMVRDDGAVVYINGVEVRRDAMPAGPITAATLANVTGSGAAEFTFFATTNTAALNAGANVVAVEVHQDQPASSDISFDLELIANTIEGASITNTIAPFVQFRTPAAGATVSSLTSVQVLFSESVTGVNASDLLINGSPATGLSGGGSIYTFTFPQPAFGMVNISWAVGHGIADQGTPVLAFNGAAASNQWSYTLADTVPPTIASRDPVAGANLTNLTQVTVTFSEPVTGVNASDFLVNGSPATGLSGGGSSYTFGFSQPAYGSVAISWAASHGITDGFGNPFNAAAATWSYSLQGPIIIFAATNGNYRYFKGLSEASTPTTLWRTNGFDDSSWLSGPGPVGYDDDPSGVFYGPFGTLITDMRNNYPSLFQRLSFNVVSAGAYTNLTLRHRVDDGTIVWLNGVEIFRTASMGSAPDVLAFNQTCANVSDQANYTTLVLPNSALALLREGTNILAIQVHNSSLSSSDLIGSVELSATLLDPTALPPTISALSPDAGNAFSLSSITVTFSERVQGIDASDLLINGTPASGVSGVSNVWTWTFPQPPYGNVNVTWAGGANITDFDAPPKPFNGAPFGYSLLNPSAPTIVAQTPLAAATVSNLTQIQVSFSENVQGVDASDFLINGAPATGVSGSGASYTFTFSQPAYGNVVITWATGHNIRDTEPAQNAFDQTRAGSTWQYTLIDLTPPSVATQNPVAGANVTNLTQLTVTFSEAVTGVNASDLLINGVPATGIAGGPVTYTFTFAPPNTSVVNINWAGNHGIFDTATQPNAFNSVAPGSTWQYITADDVAPTVANINPPPGATIRELSQVVVTFAEPVAGVSADDLLINNVPAQNVIGSAAGPYTFTFSQPATGAVDIVWAPSQNITDLAVPGNDFAGGGWNYVLNPNAIFADKIVINEIFFHPSTELTSQEWIEIHNTDSGPVNLTGWRITEGVSFTFPNVTIPANGYLVVAASVDQFQLKYPGVNNVVGDWVGQLSNSEEDIVLETATGEEVDVVHYADEGDWAIRQRGRQDVANANPLLNRGWEWFSAADGTNFNTATDGSGGLQGGRSLELRNPTMPNRYGQNWSPSVLSNGSPGVVNGQFTANIPPMILDVIHSPAVPTSSDNVTITARIRDEVATGHSVTLLQRNHTSTSPGAFISQTMFDDGLHNDGLANDGIYAAILPAQPVGTVIEFYVQAVDPANLTNTWPRPARQLDGTFQQTANALYQVDNETFTTNMPLYRIVLTGSEQFEYFNQLNSNSDAEMNATFISMDGEGTKVRYLSGMRIRGAGSRGGTPKNNRINVPRDNLWNGLSEMNLNNRFTHAQAIGSALSLKSGLPASEARPVQYRINGVNLASSGSPQYGAYVYVEPINGDWAENHYPNDGGGNAYRGSRAPWTANLDYQGTNPQTYLNLGYSKTSNQSENDWTDLFNLTFVLNQIPGDADYVQAVQTNVNVTNFMRYFAVNSLLSYRETSMARGVGDDYAMYRGVFDPRFTLIPHDFDTILNQGDTTGAATDSIFQVILSPASSSTAERANYLQRFMRHPQFVPIYFAELKRLSETVFAPTNINALIDQVLGDWPASTTIPAIKSYANARTASVLSQIPLTYSVIHTLDTSTGVARSTSATISLRGTANAIDTRSVRVSGAVGAYSAWEGRWTNNAVSLQPGYNNLLVEAVGANNNVVWSTNLLVWYDTGAFTDRSGNLAGNTIWTPGAGPYRVTGNITVPSGSTLTIQPGTTVFLNSGVSISIANGGRLLAEGTPSAGISFRSTPASGTRWGGIVINGSGSSPESRITYAHIEGNNNTAIDVSGGDAFLDHLTFGTTDRRYLDLDAASFVVSHCVFPTTTAAIEPVHGSGAPRAGGRAIFLRNFFGRVNGYNDTIDFTGGNRPGPIVQFIENVFMGSDDDILDLDGTDAWVEGNIFIGAHRNGSPDSASAVSGGSDSGQTSEVTVVGNIFYDVDQAAMAKQGNFYTFINNTVVRQNGSGYQDAGVTAVLALADDTYALALGMYVEGNIFYDIERLTRAVTNATPLFNAMTFNNNLMPLTWSGAGTNNSTADPMLTYVPQLSETAFTSWEQAQVMKQWFSLRTGSPGAGTGPNGRDKGGVIPLGASISGEPSGATSEASATLRVGFNRTGNSIPASGFPNGSGFSHYKWRLDLGPWSAETPSTTPISLSSLAPGAHRVDVVGRRDTGNYQDDTNYGPAAVITESRTWVVNPSASPLRINEVLAANSGVLLHSGTTPDAVELYNASSFPIDMEGMRLTDDPADPNKFVFPPGVEIPAGGYLVVYADAENTPGIHLGFGLSADGEGLYLYASTSEGGALLDSVVFGLQLNNLSIGRLSDGTWNLCQPTFGTANAAAPLGDPTKLRINEWLTIGLSLAQNDFIEIYNLDSVPVALGGLFLTDRPYGWPNQHEIPALSFIGGNGYRVFTADGEPEDGADHLNFTLSPEQGMIGLLNRDLSMIDCVVYLAQRVDVSQGRSPNGSLTIVPFGLPTPGAPNESVTSTNSGIVINEVLASNSSHPELDGTTPDWIELHNRSAIPVDIGDMSLSDNSLVPRRYVFAPGTIIAPLGYLRLRCDPDVPPSASNAGFGLKATGGAVFLFDKLANGGGPVSSVSHGLQTPDFSIGRVPDGSTNWVLTVPTPDAANNAAAVTLGNVNLVRINEWMAAPSSGDDWFELYNPNPQPVSIGGMYLTDNLAQRTKSQIPALSFIGGSSNGWQRFWADSNPSAGADHVNFALGAGGEALGFSASASVLIDSLTFGAQQAGVSEGRFPDGSASIVRFPKTASPGDANYLQLTNVVINEALTHTDLPLEDAIELRNMTAAPVNIGNWWLSDSKNTLRKYRIPNGTTIPANGYIVFYEYQFNFDTNDPTSFSLSSGGDNIYLSAADNNGILTGYRGSVSFGAAANGVSFGRHVTSDNREVFVAMSQRSLGVDDPGTVAQFRTGTGAANAYPLVGPVVISQIMYHPPDIGTNDNTLEEFIELKNITGGTVPLYDVAVSTNTWRVRDGVDFNFPQGVSMAPGANLLLVSFDPVENPGQLSLFRGKYGVPASVPIYGPYIGRLSNGDENIELYRPDSPNLNDVPYIEVDSVHYYDLPPWPQAADGSGLSIHRVSLAGFGNDPTNWMANFPDFGGEADSDADGLPDWWENQYAPTLNPNVNDANLDPDGDGMTNAQEYQAGTNPTQSSSALRILAIESTGLNTVRLTFLAVSNRSYRVDFKNALTDPNWTTLTNISEASFDRVIQIITTNAGPTRYYRLALTGGGPGMAGLDSDGDGMPDAWESMYALNPGSATDGNLDNDGDGLTNYEEYLASTIPTNAASVLKLSSVQPLSGNNVRLKFLAVSNKSYTIEFKNELQDSEWQSLQNVGPQGSSGTVEIDASVPGAKRFFRVRTAWQMTPEAMPLGTTALVASVSRREADSVNLAQV